MSTKIWIALIAAAASLLVAVLSATMARRTQRQMTELSDRFDEQRAERNARRDYVPAPEDVLGHGLDWRREGDGVDMTDVRTAVAAGHEYVLRRLAKVTGTTDTV